MSSSSLPAVCLELSLRQWHRAVPYAGAERSISPMTYILKCSLSNSKNLGHTPIDLRNCTFFLASLCFDSARRERYCDARKRVCFFSSSVILQVRSPIRGRARARGYCLLQWKDIDLGLYSQMVILRPRSWWTPTDRAANSTGRKRSKAKATLVQLKCLNESPCRVGLGKKFSSHHPIAQQQGSQEAPAPSSARLTG